jgi:hypothetical protein
MLTAGIGSMMGYMGILGHRADQRGILLWGMVFLYVLSAVAIIAVFPNRAPIVLIYLVVIFCARRYAVSCGTHPSARA